MTLSRLWDADPSGWFVLDSADRLLYANPACQRLTGRELQLGSQEFPIAVVSEARASVRRAYLNVRTGYKAVVATVVPALVHREQQAVRLVMTRFDDSCLGDPVVVGLAFPVAAVEPRTRPAAEVMERTEAVEKALGRVFVEVASALTDSLDDDSSGMSSSGLTERERQVLRMILNGSSTPLIASAMHLSIHTVRNHIQGLFRRLGVHSQAELIALCRARSMHPSRGRTSSGTVGAVAVSRSRSCPLVPGR